MLGDRLFPGLINDRKTILITVTGVVLFLFLFLLFWPNRKQVTIACEEEVKTFSTTTDTVEEAIKEAHIAFSDEDIIDPPLNSPIKEDTVIKIKKAKPLFIITKGDAIKTVTHKKTVRDVLHEFSINLDSSDLVTPSPDTILDTEKYNYICIRKAVNVTLKIGNKATENLKTTGKFVYQVLEDKGISLNGEDRVYPSLQCPVVEGTEIKVTRVSHEIFTESLYIPYETIIREDDTMYNGEEEVIQEGQDGRIKNTIKRYYKNGEITKEEIIDSVAISDPVDEIVFVGTRSERDAGYVLSMDATAYTPGYDCGSVTATGVPAGYGVVAVDPGVIPLGSKLYIEGYGYAIAADTGGAIWGNRIDLCFDTYGEALSYGRRSATVYILD